MNDRPEREHLAGLRIVVQIVVNALDLIHLVASEPVGVIGLFFETVIEVVGEFIFHNRQIDHDIHGQRAAQLFVEQAHALVDFGVFAEVVDEAVFHLQAAQADDAEDQHQSGDPQYLVAQTVGQARQP